MRTVSNSTPSWLRLPRSIPRSYDSAARWHALRQHITTVYVALLFTGYLFYIEPGGYDVMDDSKRRAFYALHLLYFICVALTLLVQKIPLAGKSKTSLSIPRLTVTETAAVFFGLWTWVAALRSEYWTDVLWGLSNCEGAVVLSIYIATFLLVSHYGRVGEWFYVVVGGASSLYSVVAILQMQDLNLLNLFPSGTVYSDYMSVEHNGQFLGTLGNTNLVAIFMVFSFLLMLFYLVRAESPVAMWAFIPLALTGYVLLRSWVLLGLVGAMLGMFISIPAVKKGKRRAATAIAFTAVGVLCLALVYYFPYGEGMLHELHEVLHGRWQDDFGSGRVYIWRNLLENMQGHWLFGHGPDTVIASAAEPFTTFVEETGVSYVNVFTDAHNVYLNTLYCEGLPALLGLLILSDTVLLQWIYFAPKNKHVAILGAGLCGVAISAFFCLSHFIVAPFFWCAAGLLEAELKRAKK